MEKIWLQNYDSGIPTIIDTNRYCSLNQLLEDICSKFANKNAFYNMGKYLTFADLEQQVKAFAAFLQIALNLKKGDRIAIMLPNILQYPITMFAILRIGAIVVNINPLYTPDELQQQLNDSGAVGIIVLENFANIVEQVLPNTNLKNIIITKISDMFLPPKSWLINFFIKYIKKSVPAQKIDKAIYYNDAIKKGKKLITSYTDPNLTSKDIAFLQYTGGTTGKAKGAILTHGNIIANLEQVRIWIASLVSEGHDIVITALPLYHIFSLTANCLTFLRCGALNILITNPRNINVLIKELAKFKFTVITGVNTLFNALLSHPDFSKLDFSKLRIALGGGMAVQSSVAERWQQVTKKPLLEAYGLTEASPAVCINPMYLNGYNGTIGLPIPSTEISIINENDQEMPIGIAGELCIRGPQVMQGYWNKEEETNKVLTKDGWLRTGDIAIINQQGYVKIIDRKKDMIIISGFKVYPNEIENVIAMLDGVKEVAVIGVPHDVKGELVKAFVVPKEGVNLTADQVINYCKQHLTHYKVPKIIEFITELPKSNVGKILRRKLS